MSGKNRIKLDIVDTQIHIGPGRIEETLSSMDALGIQSVIVDEYWLHDVFRYDPHHALENGEIRPVCPTAELAAQLYPERFSWVLRVGRRDPEYASVIRMVKDAPGGCGIRMIPGMASTDMKAFARGEFDHILSAVSECGLPLFIHLPDHPELVAACAKKFPELRIIVDHCGLFHNNMRAMLEEKKFLSDAEQLALYDKVLGLSEYPNIALKWAHYSTMFNIPAFPGEGLRPILRKTISAFGRERLMWASDFSVNQSGENWGELLYGMKCNTDLSDQELEALLGGTARIWLKK